MVRKSVSLKTALFLAPLALALHAPLPALGSGTTNSPQTPGSINCSGGFLTADSTYVALYVCTGMQRVSLTSATAHIWGSISATNITYVSTNEADVISNVSYNGLPARLTGTISRLSTSSPWKVAFNVTANGNTLASYGGTNTCPFKGTLAITMPK